MERVRMPDLDLSSMGHVTCICLRTVKISQRKWGLHRFILFIYIMPLFNRVHTLTETAN